ncbi:Pleckstriny domain-containing family F member 2 [Balamuthia mandrillaris]
MAEPKEQVVVSSEGGDGGVATKVEVSANPPLQTQEQAPMTAEQKRNLAVQEILTTERTYVQSLQIIVNSYLKPLQLKNLLPKKQIEFIFSNLEHILIINAELLGSLEERMIPTEWAAKQQTVGDVMNKLIPWLKLYRLYCENYHNASQRLVELMEKNATLSEFLTKTVETERVLDLPSLLIMPIQRIPRYKMLLEQTIKYTSETHPDYEPLNHALSKVNEVADVINDSVRTRQNFEQLQELEKRLTGKLPKNFARPYRALIHQGVLTKLCRKIPKPRYFFLFNDLLMYGEESKAKVYSDFNIHRFISLRSGRISDVEDSSKAKNAFKVVSKEKSFLVWASSPEEKQLWAQKIEEAAVSREKWKIIKSEDGDEEEEEYDAPIWVNDQEFKECMLCTIKFTAIRRKHHCRKCGKLVCNKCSEKRWELPNIGKERVCDVCFEELSSEGARRKSIRMPSPSNAGNGEGGSSSLSSKIDAMYNKDPSGRGQSFRLPPPKPLSLASLKAEPRELSRGHSATQSAPNLPTPSAGTSSPLNPRHIPNKALPVVPSPTSPKSTTNGHSSSSSSRPGLNKSGTGMRGPHSKSPPKTLRKLPSKPLPPPPTSTLSAAVDALALEGNNNNNKGLSTGLSASMRAPPPRPARAPRGSNTNSPPVTTGSAHPFDQPPSRAPPRPPG